MKFATVFVGVLGVVTTNAFYVPYVHNVSAMKLF